MDEQNNSAPRFIRIWRKAGPTKFFLATTCFLLFGSFFALVLLQFVDLIAVQCNSVYPFIGCNHIDVVVALAGTLVVGFIGPVWTVEWLIRRSFFFLTSLLFGLLALMAGGFVFLKKLYYERNV